MRKFLINNINYQFSSSKFAKTFVLYRKRKKLSVDELEQKLAELVFVEKGTVHSWRFGPSGPSDIDTIAKLAEFFELNNYFYLLNREITMIKLTNLQLESAKKIYDAIIKFLDEFYYTGGFTTDMWYDFVRKGSRNPERDVYDYIENLEDKIRLIVKQEYFFLHDTQIYNELIDYIDNDLNDTYNGKVSYAYRFEADGENAPTTEDDYNKAMNKLNSIIEKYC